ncbi:MAG: SiaB family protein kinase [Pseudomonadota bacterium]
MDLFDLFNRLRGEGILFCFSGPTSQGILEGLGDALKQKMEREAAGSEMIRRVFAVFVEQMQNVINYSAERVAGPPEADGEMREGVVVVGRQGESCFVLVGNYVDQEEGRRLAEQVEMLQGMDKEQMKAHYKEQRRKQPPAGSKGAGLGIIETARKASRPLELDIKETGQGRVFFTLKAII